MVLAGLQPRRLEASHARWRILCHGRRRKRRPELDRCARTAVPTACARLERNAGCQGPSEAGSTRRTTLKSAPPLANALTSAMRAGARTRLVARFREAEAGSGDLSPAIGGTALTDPQSDGCNHRCGARRSTLADGTLDGGHHRPGSAEHLGQCLRLDASSTCVELADGVHHVHVRGRYPRVVERQAHRPHQRLRTIRPGVERHRGARRSDAEDLGQSSRRRGPRQWSPARATRRSRPPPSRSRVGAR